MTWTGTKFAMDAINNGEVSFTEWGIQYWPVKLMLPIGAALMALQGLSKLIKDIVFVTGRRALAMGTRNRYRMADRSAVRLACNTARAWFADGVGHRQPCNYLPVRVR